jgi:23S rRNA (guanosine2251-2'-O)-methyltransferase
MRNVIGFHAIEEALQKQYRQAVLYLDVSAHKRNRHLQALAERQGIRTVSASRTELDRMAEGSNHRGAILQISGSESLPSSLGLDLCIEQSAQEPASLVLVLDGITDPQNLGAVMRSADLFGVDFIVLPERRSASVNQTVMKVSSGAAEHVRFSVVPNLVRALEKLKEAGYWIYGADMEGAAADAADLAERAALVLGSEESGLSRLVREHCDRIISIPTSGHIDSLNVAAAASVLMYEAGRQRRARSGE